MKPRARNRFGPKSIERREAIGAFCTDIANSTERIERFQQSALSHHKQYLEGVGSYFLKRAPKSERGVAGLDELWVPGDGLWSVFCSDPSETLAESIVRSLWRAVASFGYGLSMSQPRPSSALPPLEIRGAFLAGPVIMETLFDGRLRLYSGRALNACGRLQSVIDENTVVAGFVVPTHEDPKAINVVARSPLIYVNGNGGLNRYLRLCPKPSRYGCRILVDVVSNDGRRALRFQGWPTRSHLRGLGNCHVITTSLKLELTREADFEISYINSGEWDRVERSFPLSDARNEDWDLHDVIPDDSAFAFLKQIYAYGRLRFSNAANSSFVLTVNENHDRPQLDGIGTVNTAHFGDHSCCVLPTNRHPVAGGRNVLMQTYMKGETRYLCLCLTREDRLLAYDDWSDFLDSAAPTLEIAFR